MSEHECSGTDCASLVRIKALERTLEDEKKERSRSHEKIYNRLGALERGMTAVTSTARSLHSLPPCPLI